MRAVSTGNVSCLLPRAMAQRRPNCRWSIKALPVAGPSAQSTNRREGKGMTGHRQHELPLWHRVLDLPLIAMLVAVALYLVAGALGVVLGRYVSVGAPATGIVQTAITLALVLATYKLVIVRLGGRPRDDLRAADSLQDVGKGIALGIALFSLVVGI